MQTWMLAMLFIFVSIDSNAQDCQDTNGTSIAFINGIRVSKHDVSDYLRNFKQIVSVLNLDSNGVNIVPAYNHHENFFEDAMQALFDKLEVERPAQFWRIVFGDPSLEDGLSEELKDLIKYTFTGSLAQFIINGRHTSSSIINILQNQLDNNKKLIIIGHSQGSLYANSSYNALISNLTNDNRRRIIGMLHVASVASNVGPMEFPILGDYTTFHGDLIVLAVRAFLGNVLSSNQGVSPLIAPLLLHIDGTLHGFPEIYVNEAFAYIFNNDLLTDIKNKISIISTNLKCNENVLACFEIDPNGLPGEYIKNADGTDGGFVSTGSTVAPSAYLGAEAEVCNGAQVLGNATVTGPALISDPGTVVRDSALISGDVTVDSGARVYEQAKIFDTTRVGLEAKVFGRAEVHGDSVIIGYSEISGDAKLDGRHLVVSFGDNTKKVQIKGDVQIAGNYIIAMNATIDGTFKFTKKGAVVGDVQMLGGGEIEYTGINNQAQIFTDNLTSLGAGDFGVFLFDNIKLEGSPTLKDMAIIRGNAYIGNQAVVAGRAVVRDNAQVKNFAQVKDDSMIWGDAVISGFASITGNSWVGANCTVSDATLFNVNIPNVFDKSDINNLYCPGYYEPAPVGGPALAAASFKTTTSARSNFVEMTPQETWQQMYDEEVRRYQAILAEAEEIKRKYLGREYQNEALERARAVAGE